MGYKRFVSTKWLMAFFLRLRFVYKRIIVFQGRQISDL